MKEFIVKNKTKIIFTIILIVGILIRIFEWPTAISQVNCDEAMTAINANAIAQTGSDIYGTTFPVYLEAWSVFGQSVVLMYIMAFFIKLFGFSFITVRLPMLFISIVSLLIFYDLLKRIFKNKKVALLGFGFLAICPWHIMQSIWSIDCNMFPHFMLISVYLLYRGITDKKWLLYLSMFFFAVTMYTYGVSIYVVPLFLLITAVYLLLKKQVHFKQLLLCMLIYFIFSLPILTMYFLNFFHIDTDIHIGQMTIQYFENNTRTSDMLFFSENIGTTFVSNLKALIQTIFVGFDGLEWNSTPIFGTVYHISLIFFLLGIFIFFKKNIIDFIKKRKNSRDESSNVQENDYNNQIGMSLIFIWLILSLFLGIIINSVNINRLNIVWYPMIIFIIFGFEKIIEKKKFFIYIITVLYLALFICFSCYFYGNYTDKIDMSGCFSRKYIDAVHFAGQMATQKDISQILYFNEKNDGALDVYTKFQAQLDDISITCIKDKNEIIEKIKDSNSILIIHKEYIEDYQLFDIYNISNFNQIIFEDYIVLVSSR